MVEKQEIPVRKEKEVEEEEGEGEEEEKEEEKKKHIKEEPLSEEEHAPAQPLLVQRKSRKRKKELMSTNGRNYSFKDFIIELPGYIMLKIQSEIYQRCSLK